MTILARLSLCGAALAALLLPSTAYAAVLTFSADYEFSGGTAPSGSPPWYTLSFDDGGGVGSVLLTLTATNLTGAENVLHLMFNLNPAMNGNLPLTFAGLVKVGSFDTPSIAQGVDAYKADGDGFYDFDLEFASGGNTSKTFTQGDVLQYTITGPGLVAASFNFLSLDAGGHGPFLMAAHIQNTGGGSQSGWVTQSPEPSALFLAMLGLAGLCLARRRRHRPAH
jgi:MYXO-CTERM domain-containing protein